MNRPAHVSPLYRNGFPAVSLLISYFQLPLSLPDPMQKALCVILWLTSPYLVPGLTNRPADRSNRRAPSQSRPIFAILSPTIADSSAVRPQLCLGTAFRATSRGYGHILGGCAVLSCIPKPFFSNRASLTGRPWGKWLRLLEPSLLAMTPPFMLPAAHRHWLTVQINWLPQLRCSACHHTLVSGLQPWRCRVRNTSDRNH